MVEKHQKKKDDQQDELAKLKDENKQNDTKESESDVGHNNDSDVMMDPDQVEEHEDLSTKYLTIAGKGTGGGKRSSRQIHTKYGYHAFIKWEHLTDNSHFELVKKFKGGYGEVLILKSKKTGEMVVVKKNCKGDNIDADTANEITQMKLLKNKSKYLINLLGISVYDQEKGRVAILMQYGGKRLDDFLGDFSDDMKNSDEFRVILEDVLLKIAIGIKDIHIQNIMHRDIKEANVFVIYSDGKYQPRIGDFGIARNIKEFQSLSGSILSEMQITKRMTKVGTVPYMAPEMDYDEPYDGKVDCFAWAKMAINCHKLCGFVEKTKAVKKIKHPEISEAFLTVIKEALEEDPDDRLSASDVVNRLENLTYFF